MFGQAFKSRVAVVTASTSGIGSETARLLAQGGAETVVINGRNRDTGAKVLKQLSTAFPATNFRFNRGRSEYSGTVTCAVRLDSARDGAS